MLGPPGHWSLIGHCTLLIDLLLAGGALTAQPSSRPAVAAPAYPRIAMLWSRASGLKEGRWANVARHDVVVMGVEDVGLEWTPHRHPAMAETFVAESIEPGRENLDRIAKLNPRAVVLLEVYFFEDDRKAYPSDHEWWLRDDKGRKRTFWPGTWRMDLENAEYVSHVARRIAAVHGACGGRAGVFLDNLRFDPAGKVAWTSLLRQVRKLCGDKMPILVNAGWSSTDLDFLAPFVNGVMYEDSIRHLPEDMRDDEVFYARIAALDARLRRPTVSVNEVFGKRKDAERMRRELLRTLVYTNMAFLYSDSTHGHKHAWYDAWDAPLGSALDPPLTPQPGKLARRPFEGGEVFWLPATAEGAVEVKLDTPMRDAFSDETVREVRLLPGRGILLLYAAGAATRSPAGR
jgi:hypothetical protein